MEEKTNCLRNPSRSSIIYSEQTQDTLSYREPLIHSIFSKTYHLSDKKIRSSSFSSQMKSMIIKNLIMKTPQKINSSLSAKPLIKSASIFSSCKGNGINILPTSHELNAKFLRIKTDEKNFDFKTAEKMKKHKKNQISEFSTGLHLSLCNSGNALIPEIFSENKPRSNTNISRLRIPSGYQSPQRSLFDKSQKSFTSFEIMSSRHKRKTSICKKNNPQKTIFKVNEKNIDEDQDNPIYLKLKQSNLNKGNYLLYQS